jgi:hypothetical protein
MSICRSGAFAENFDTIKLNLNFEFMFADRALDELERCADEIERLLSRAARRLRKRIEGDLASMDQERGNEYAASVAEDLDNLAKGFPDIVRTSLFIM